MSVVPAELGGSRAPPFPAGTLGHLQRLLGPTHLHVVDFAGRVREHAEMQRVRYVGTGSNFRYLADLLFSGFEIEDSSILSSPYALLRISGRDWRANATPGSRFNLLITDLSPAWHPAGALLTRVRVPAWLRQEITIPFGGRLLPRSAESETRRLTRRQGLSVDFARSGVLVRRFYHEYYVPYVTARFGAQAIVVSEDVFMQGAGRKWLGRVFANGEWIAGMLIEQHRDLMRLGWFGARHHPACRGASEVLDAACIRRAGMLGLSRVHMGSSRPSLIDGVLRYKARFGATLRPARFPQDIMGLSLLDPGDALLDRVQKLQLVRFQQGKPRVYQVKRSGADVSVTLASVPAPETRSSGARASGAGSPGARP